MKCRSAFTLVEMLVALAVTSILTILMLKMFSDSSTIWKKHDEKLDTFREARAALQLMARELSTVIPQKDISSNLAGVPITSIAGNEQFPVLALRTRTPRPAPSTGTDAPLDLSTAFYTSAYALAAVPNTGRSDLCAVGYYLEWDTTLNDYNQPRNAYVLKRQAANSDKTFGFLKASLNSAEPLVGAKAFATVYGQGGMTANDIQNVATYIWDLEFSIPANTATRTGTSIPTANPALPDAYFGRELPQWVEIRFKALGSAAAGKLYGQSMDQATWSDKTSTTYQRLILPSEQEFVTRVKLNR
jgi:prepilin-type N-terminal cleavage/methylation domain-containing protein